LSQFYNRLVCGEVGVRIGWRRISLEQAREEK
jgi:hypothetical protein